MAVDSFLKIDGIKGESTDDKHKNWIEISSFSSGISQPTSATASSAGGATTERCYHQDFSITKEMDIASPDIALFCCNGKHVKEVIVELCRAGEKKLPYMKYTMNNVVISSYSPAGGGGLPNESVTYNYGKIKWEYTQQKSAGGGGGGKATGGWDLEINTKL